MHNTHPTGGKEAGTRLKAHRTRGRQGENPPHSCGGGGQIGTSTFEPSAIVEGQWIADRRGRERVVAEQPPYPRAERQAERFDIASPENSAKLDAAEALARLAEDAGTTLVQLALAFVLEHPAVTSAIIGPRTFEQLAGQLGADRVRLGGDILDQIDKIVPPGTNLSARDGGYQPAALADPALRRRTARSA